MEPTTTQRSSTDSISSPEFDFWRQQNPSCPQPRLVSADQLFVDGVILHLRLFPRNPPDPEAEVVVESSSAPAPVTSASKRWRDMFKKKTSSEGGDEKDKKKKERKSGGGGANTAELNINLWPFSRSRSAGNAGTRPKSALGAPKTRKVNSAPCSRSNSTRESKSTTRKWPASPIRGVGIHLGRSSPVWQVRRGGAVSSGLSRTSDTQIRNGEKGAKKEASAETRRSKTAAGGGAKPRVLNVPTCIGYRSHLSCRSDVMNSAVGIRDSSGSSNNRGAAGDVGAVSNNLFNLRSIFTKKVY